MSAVLFFFYCFKMHYCSKCGLSKMCKMFLKGKIIIICRTYYSVLRDYNMQSVKLFPFICYLAIIYLTCYLK